MNNNPAPDGDRSTAAGPIRSAAEVLLYRHYANDAAGMVVAANELRKALGEDGDRIAREARDGAAPDGDRSAKEEQHG